MRMSSDDLNQKFDLAKSGDLHAIDEIVSYFKEKVENQLNNLNLNPKEKFEKSNICYKIVIRNLHIYYSASDFVAKTFDDIKNAIYLNRISDLGGSEEIVIAQRNIIKAKLTVSDLASLNLDAKEKELARLYYLEDKNIGDIIAIYNCSERLIYHKLRKVANMLVAKKMSNDVPNEDTFLYR